MGYLRVQVFPFAVSVEIIFVVDFCLYLVFILIIFFPFFFSFLFFQKKKGKKKCPECFLFITPANGCCSDDSQSACRGKNR